MYFLKSILTTLSPQFVDKKSLKIDMSQELKIKKKRGYEMKYSNVIKDFLIYWSKDIEIQTQDQ